MPTAEPIERNKNHKFIEESPRFQSQILGMRNPTKLHLVIDFK